MLDLGTSILNSVERIPNASAITNKNKTLSYIEWFSIIDRLSGSLKDLGLKKGEFAMLRFSIFSSILEFLASEDSACVSSQNTVPISSPRRRHSG